MKCEKRPLRVKMEKHAQQRGKKGGLRTRITTQGSQLCLAFSYVVYVMGSKQLKAINGKMRIMTAQSILFSISTLRRI